MVRLAECCLSDLRARKKFTVRWRGEVANDREKQAVPLEVIQIVPERVGLMFGLLLMSCPDGQTLLFNIISYRSFTNVFHPQIIHYN